MHVSVAMGMQQDAVFCSRCAAQRFLNAGVVVPACQGCERVGADRAGTALRCPQVGQGTFSLQGFFHLSAAAFFPREGPGRVVGGAVACDCRLSGSWGCGGVAKPVADGVAVPNKGPFLCPDRPHYRSAPHLWPCCGCLRLAHRPRALPRAVSTWTQVAFAAACRWPCAHPRLGGLRCGTTPCAVACVLSLMTLRMLGRHACTFFFEGRGRQCPVS